MNTTAVQQASQIVEVQGAVSTTQGTGDEFRVAFAANMGDAPTQKADQSNGKAASDVLAALGAQASSKGILSSALLAKNGAIATNGLVQAGLKAASAGASNAANAVDDSTNQASLLATPDPVVDQGAIAEASQEATVKLSGETAAPPVDLPIAKAGDLPLRGSKADLAAGVERSEQATTLDPVKSGGSAKTLDGIPAKARKEEVSNHSSGVAVPTLPGAADVRSESLAAIASAPVIPGGATTTVQGMKTRTTDAGSIAQSGIKTAVLTSVSAVSDLANTASASVASTPGDSAGMHKSVGIPVTRAGSKIGVSDQTTTSAWMGGASTLRTAILKAPPLRTENGTGDLAGASEPVSNTLYPAAHEAVVSASGVLAGSSGLRAGLVGHGLVSTGGLEGISSSTATSKASTGLHVVESVDTPFIPDTAVAETTGFAAASAAATAQVALTREPASAARPLAETTQLATKVATKSDRTKVAADVSEPVAASDASSSQSIPGHIATGSANDTAAAIPAGEVRTTSALDVANPSLQATVHSASATSHSDVSQRGGTSPAHGGSDIKATASSETVSAGGQIAESHRTLLATPDTLEVGVPGGTQGWLRIRAQVGDQGGVNASLTAGSTEGRELLHSQMPALNAFLHSEHLAVTTTVADRGSVVADGSQTGTSSNRQGSQDGSNSSLLQGGSQDSGTSGEPHRDTAGVGASELRRSYDPSREIEQTRGSVSSRALLSEDSGRWLNVRV